MCGVMFVLVPLVVMLSAGRADSAYTSAIYSTLSHAGAARHRCRAGEHGELENADLRHC